MKITEENYYTDTSHVTNTMLGYLAESPRSLQTYLNNIGFKKQTPSMMLGESYHLAILEPDKYEDVAIMPEANLRTIEGRKNRQAWLDTNSERKSLTAKDNDLICQMRDVIYSSKSIVELLTGEHEEIHLWKHEIEKDIIKCKCKTDNRYSGKMVDLKTSSSIRKSDFTESCRKYGYFRQAAYYLDGVNDKFFTFVVQKKTYPFPVAVFECSKAFIEQGRSEYMKLLSQYNLFLKNKLLIYHTHIL